MSISVQNYYLSSQSYSEKLFVQIIGLDMCSIHVPCLPSFLILFRETENNYGGGSSLKYNIM